MAGQNMTTNTYESHYCKLVSEQLSLLCYSLLLFIGLCTKQYTTFVVAAFTHGIKFKKNHPFSPCRQADLEDELSPAKAGEPWHKDVTAAGMKHGPN